MRAKAGSAIVTVEVLRKFLCWRLVAYNDDVVSDTGAKLWTNRRAKWVLKWNIFEDTPTNVSESNKEEK